MKDYNCDVLVVGAGLSGIAAAAASARAGRKTCLIEQNDFLGGEAVSGMHAYLCGLFLGDSAGLANNGIVKEIYGLLAKRKAVAVNMGKVYALRFETKSLIWALKQIIRDKNLKVFYQHKAIKPYVKNKKIISVIVKGKKGLISIKPKAVVDCSGGVIQKIKSAILRDKGKKHLGGYCFKVNANCRDEFLGVKVAYALRKGVDAKKLPWYFRLTQTTILNKQAAVIKMTMPYDAKHLKSAKSESIRMFDYLRHNIKELKTGKIVKHGVLLERSGVRLNAQTILTANDVILGKKHFFNVAAKGSWPIEFWGDKGVEYVYCQSGHYDILQGSLRAKNIVNLFAGGRFIGADIKALASVRVSGISMATGEAAGISAAKII